MILFVSDGRLGNQLFQYAFLNTIAKEGEKIITINMEQLVRYFEIKNKNFKHIYVNKYMIFFIRKFLLPYILKSLVKLKILSYIEQERNETSALPSFKKKKGFLPITYVNTDFFQSEVFFDKNKVDFTIKEEYIQKAKEFLAQVPKGYTYIFVHVRRGDYVFEDYLGVKGIDLPKNYYLKAIDMLCKEVEKPFFIFLSDDPNFVECCFEDITNKVISKDNDPATDLAIMTLCEYGICSNSSFSWWGAYMMKTRKKVIFPKYWYGWKHKIESHIAIYPTWAEVIEVD